MMQRYGVLPPDLGPDEAVPRSVRKVTRLQSLAYASGYD